MRSISRGFSQPADETGANTVVSDRKLNVYPVKSSFQHVIMGDTSQGHSPSSHALLKFCDVVAVWLFIPYHHLSSPLLPFSKCLSRLALNSTLKVYCITMTNELASKAALPTVPAPVYSAQPMMSTTVTTQPKARSQMSIEDPEVLRLRGGCGCLIGGLAVETG